LHGGRAGRFSRRLVAERQIAIETSGGINYPVGNLFDYNGPTLMVTSIFHKPEFSAEQTITAFDEIIAEVREHGVSESELDQVKVKFRSDFFSMLEGGMGAHMPRFGLMHCLACFTLFDNDPQRINTVLDEFLQVTPPQVRDVANKILTPAQRSILIRKPTGNGGAR
jgi:predicted Zn-dependent peptidase